MRVMEIIGGILLVILLLGLIRVGAVVTVGDEVRVAARFGLIRITIFPRKKKAPKPKKKTEEAPKEEAPKAPEKKKRQLPKLDFYDLLDLLDAAFPALSATARRACSRLRIDPLDMTVVFGSLNPADTARFHGIACAAMYAVMPRLERLFYIPAPSLHLRMSFDSDHTSASGTVGVSLRVCDLFAIAPTLLIPLGKWYLSFREAHQPDKEEPAPKTDETDDKIA